MKTTIYIYDGAYLCPWMPLFAKEHTVSLISVEPKDIGLKSEQYLYLMRGLIAAYKRFFSPPIRHHLFPSTLLLVPIYEGEAQALIWLI